MTNMDKIKTLPLLFITLGVFLSTTSASPFVEAELRPVLTAPPSQPVALKPRIVNGKNAAKNQFPFQGLLTSRTPNGMALCGCTLISNLWVLTAAHCVEEVSILRVALGGIQTQANDAGRVKLITTARNVIVHPGYEPPSPTHDIALIRLPRPVQPTEFIQYARLPKADEGTFVGRNVTASGYGLQSSSASYVASQLQYTQLHVISNEECSEVYGTEVIKDSIICAQGKTTQSVCSGDSGKSIQSIYI